MGGKFLKTLIMTPPPKTIKHYIPSTPFLCPVWVPVSFGGVYIPSLSLKTPQLFSNVCTAVFSEALFIALLLQCGCTLL